MGAQSGRSSAVGWGIESAFRSAPLTNLSGSVYRAGIDATNPMRFVGVEPGGGYPTKPTKDVSTTEQDGDYETHRITLTGKLYDGKDSWKMDPENAYYPLLGITGRDVENTITAGVYDHVMYHKFPGYMPSFTQEESFGDASSGQLSTGVCFNEVTINHNAILMMECSYYAHRQIPNRYPAAGGVDTDYDFTNAAGLLPSQLGGDHTKQVKINLSPSYVDVAETNCGNGPLVFANMANGNAASYAGASGAAFSSAFVTLNDNAIQADFLPGFSIKMTRDIERNMVGGSGYDASVPVAGAFTVSGKMDIIFRDNQIGSTGYYYEYEVYLPHVKFLDADRTRADKTMSVGGNFHAKKDPVLGYSCRIRLRNAFTHASLAGGYPQAGNGLGGWASTP
jgi:hypothetical protein